MEALFCCLEQSSAQPPAFAQLIADVAAVPQPAFQRASSPLRKHKRKASAPHRSALDVVAAELAPLSSETEEDDLSMESARKERRSSSSPDPVSQRAGRSARPQRAASLQQPPAALALPLPLPLPDQLAAAFDAPLPPFLAVAAAAPAGAPKVCVQCGTSTTPMWRTVNGLTYCNADGLRLKRKLGLL